MAMAWKWTFPTAAIFSSVVVFSCCGEVARADEAAALAADQQLASALEKEDVAGAAKLLDAGFEWTDSSGKTLTKSETGRDMKALAGDMRDESGVRSYSYGNVEVLVGAHHYERFTRVWVRRAAGWRAFIFIDTTIGTGAAPFSAPASGGSGDCENPCRKMPYTPASEADKQIAAIFQRLKVDEWHPNPEDWMQYVVDGVDYVTSAAALSKADRVAHLEQQKQSGVAILPGDPVIAMRIFDFDGAAVMLAKHAPYRGGKPYYSLRVWTMRDGRWQLANSQQTAIAAADTLPPVGATK